IALFGTLVLLANRKLPAMLLLLVFGAVAAVFENPRLLDELAAIEVAPRLPAFALETMTWRDVALGTVFLALPQIPLTLGNAIIAPVEENNRLFPDRPVTEKKASISTGLMNIMSPLFGGLPMCHGAGGMAGHVRFGARTGGALIILGVVILLTALFLSGSIQTLFKIFPSPVLGVILFLTGSQLALGICDPGDKHDRFAMLTTAAFAVWNIGLAFVVGMAIHFLLKRGIVKL
ncbi:MAG TPA: putative sulfate/molybdate transporter, partial [Blastocatellia bacterium]|nr:putative sulfate/molybdate transporter [Blastocatellia bacterium]